MLNSLEIFNQQFAILNFEKSKFIMPYNKTSLFFQKRMNSIKVLNEIFEQNFNQIKEATERDIEREHFPINVELSFKESFKKFEMSEFIVYDKSKTFYGLQQVWFRHHILKLQSERYDYTYSINIQTVINNFLQNHSFSNSDYTFTRKFKTLKEFDFFLRDLANIYRDNLENINKAMFE